MRHLMLTAAMSAALAAGACATMQSQDVADADAGAATLEEHASDAMSMDMEVSKMLSLSAAHQARLDLVLADDRRADDKARDGARNPGDTLAFFGVAPDMRVVEVLPGGGWYTRVLLPYVGVEGDYFALNYSQDTLKAIFGDAYESRREALEGWSASFPETAADWGPETASVDGAFHFGDVPEGLKGTMDRVILPRALHNMHRVGTLEAGIADIYALLKPGGVAGVVQHRANPDASDEYADGSKGYLREMDVIAKFEAAGFKTLRLSEINANPKDTADYEGGVWTLPPRLAKGEEDKAKYEAIGESDRMTIAFMKPHKMAE